MICNACGGIATLDLGEDYRLCSRCEEIFTREFPHLSAKLNSNFAVESSLQNDAAVAHPFGFPADTTVTAADFDDGIPEILRRKRVAA